MRTFSQLGVSGINRQGPYIYEEFLPELRWPGAARIYQEMSDNDPVIGSILYLAEMLIRGASWDVEPASNDKEDIEAANFLKSCMNDMETSWANVISEILSMLTYGFSFHEILYKVRRGPNENARKWKSQYSDGKIGWRGMPIRSQTSFHGWKWDSEGYVSHFTQLAPPDYRVIDIPMAKGLLFRTRVTKDNPEGKSLLRNAYRPWFFKKHFEEIEGIGVERDLAGFPVLKAPENLNIWDSEDPNMVRIRGEAEQLVTSIRRDSEEGVLLPFGWDLKLLTSGSSRQIDIGSTIDRYDNRIAITMLSDVILIGGKSGSFALADTKRSMLAAALQSQLLNIADVFNTKAVPDLFRFNAYKLEKLPKIVPGQIQVPSLRELALMIRAMGLNIAGDMQLQNYLRRILGAPVLDEEGFEENYEPQLIKDLPQATDTNTGNSKSDLLTARDVEDALANEFEQSDMSYTGGNE